jgi:hypothetical protein
VLTFVAGSATDVFSGDFAGQVEAELRKRYGFESAKLEDPYRSEPVNGAGWRDLQNLNRSMLGDTAAPHLTGIEAYQAVYVPVPLAKVEQIRIANAADPLQVGSLTALIDHLTQFAARASLPTDDVQLMGLAAHYLEDDSSFERELDVQVYVQLMLSAKQAVARKQALWIVV